MCVCVFAQITDKKRMEKNGTQRQPTASRSAVPLDLNKHIPVRDVRQLIWRYLTSVDREMVRCAHNARRIPAISSGGIDAIAERGDLALLQWLWVKCPNWSKTASLSAAKGGHVHVLKWLWTLKVDRNPQHRVWGPLEWAAATGAGRLAALQYLYEKGIAWDSTATYAAAYGGHLDVLEWMLANGAPRPKSFAQKLCERNRLDVLCWLHARGGGGVAGPFDSILSWAAVYGRVDIIRWAVENGAECPTGLYAAAANGGHVGVFEYLRALAIPWDSSTLSTLASKGYVGAFKWAYEHGAPWIGDPYGPWRSFASRHPEMLAHLRESGLIHF